MYADSICLDRPIVTGPIVGLILGDVHTGIVMGASLELVMMGIVGIGAGHAAGCGLRRNIGNGICHHVRP